jgi:hypothetical protein
MNKNHDFQNVEKMAWLIEKCRHIIDRIEKSKDTLSTRLSYMDTLLQFKDNSGNIHPDVGKILPPYDYFSASEIENGSVDLLWRDFLKAMQREKRTKLLETTIGEIGGIKKKLKKKVKRGQQLPEGSIEKMKKLEYTKKRVLEVLWTKPS